MNGPWDQTVRLSKTGDARHQAILSGMKHVLRRRVRRRRGAWALATAATAVMLVGGALLTVRMHAAGVGSARPQIAAAETRNATNSGGPIMQHAAFQMVQTQAASALSQSRALITVLDDDQLLSELQALGKPSGLIRKGDAVLLTGDVGAKVSGSVEAPGRS